MKRSILVSIAILLTSLIAPAKNKAPQFVMFNNTHGVTFIKLKYPGKECKVSEAYFFNDGKKQSSNSIHTQFNAQENQSEIEILFPYSAIFRSCSVDVNINGDNFNIPIYQSGIRRNVDSSFYNVTGYSNSPNNILKIASVNSFGMRTTIKLSYKGKVKNIGKPTMTNNGKTMEAKFVNSRYDAKNNVTNITVKFKYVDEFYRCVINIPINGTDYKLPVRADVRADTFIWPL